MSKQITELLAQHVAKDENLRDNKQVRALLRDNKRLRGVIAAAHGIRTENVEVRAFKKVLSTGKRRACAVVMASDWHVGERVDRKKVAGINHYNPKIAAFRAERFFSAIVHMIETYKQSNWDIRDLVLCLNGDLISGFIHEELKESNFMSPTKETAYAERLISAGLKFLAEYLPEVKIHCVCQPGNHGRTTHKTQLATYVENSFEWLCYYYLREKNPQCTWQIGAGLHSVFDAYGMRVHVHHGDTVRSQGGVGGILVPLNKARLGWAKKYKAHMSMVGHFHQYMDLPSIVVNGSLIGYGSYADSLPMAEAEPPQQAFFLIDEKRGKCQSTPLWCGDPSAEKTL